MAGYNFDLQSAQRIVAAVKKVENQPRDLTGAANKSLPAGTSFWAMLTGCDTTGKLWDWVAVQPDPKAMATPSPSNILATNMWAFREPWTAGWGCAREANDNLGVPVGTVAMLTLLGYGQANVATDGTQLNGVATIEGNGPLVSADGLIPFYTFSYNLQPPQVGVPIHDHRDNVTGGGFAFSVYHPGTSLPQQNWSM